MALSSSVHLNLVFLGGLTGGAWGVGWIGDGDETGWIGFWGAMYAVGVSG